MEGRHCLWVCKYVRGGRKKLKSFSRNPDSGSMKGSVLIALILSVAAYVEAAENPIDVMNYAYELCRSLSPRNHTPCNDGVPQLINARSNRPGIAILTCNLPSQLEEPRVVIDCYNAANRFNLPLRQCNRVLNYPGRIACITQMFEAEQRRHAIAPALKTKLPRSRIVDGDRRPKPVGSETSDGAHGSGATSN